VFEVAKKAEELGIFVDMKREFVCYTCISRFAELYATFVEFVEIAVGTGFKRLLERNVALQKYHFSRILSTMVEQTDEDGLKIRLHRECSPPPNNYGPSSDEDFGDHGDDLLGVYEI